MRILYDLTILIVHLRCFRYNHREITMNLYCFREFTKNLPWLSTSNDYNFDFSKKCRFKTCILNIFRLIDPIFPYSSSLTIFRPLMIFDHSNWPWITSNLNYSQNFELKHMYLVYILTKRPNLTRIRRIWPKFDLWWLSVTWIGLK